MNKHSALYWLQALSPVHVGTGRGDGFIDLPIAREKTSEYPFIPGSSVKGVFAENCNASDEGSREKSDLLKTAFGLAGNTESVPGNAGSLIFSDARLCCLAVRSLFGTFSWCTCPMVLRRLARDVEFVGGSPPDKELNITEMSTALVTDLQTSSLVNSGKIFLEDLDLVAKSDIKMKKWAELIASAIFAANKEWQKVFMDRFVVVSDDLFKFLVVHATEVQAHIRIDHEFKRVVDGQLWYEESLPVESVLCGIVYCDKLFGATKITENKVFELCTEKSNTALQIGGKASVGKGRVNFAISHNQSQGHSNTEQ